MLPSVRLLVWMCMHDRWSLRRSTATRVRCSGSFVPARRSRAVGRLRPPAGPAGSSRSWSRPWPRTRRGLSRSCLGRRCSTACSEGRGAFSAVVGGLVAVAPIGLRWEPASPLEGHWGTLVGRQWRAGPTSGHRHPACLATAHPVGPSRRPLRARLARLTTPARVSRSVRLRSGPGQRPLRGPQGLRVRWLILGSTLGRVAR